MAPIDRKEFLRLSALLAAGGLAAVSRLGLKDLHALGRDGHRAASVDGQPLRTFDAQAALTVTVAAEHIIPATTTPGATQANVTAFIDTMLNGWYPAADQARFLAGVQELDVRSNTRCGKPFAQCAPADQLALLEVLDAEVTSLRQAQSAAANDHWFAMLKYLTVWGYCTSEIGMRDTLRTQPMPMRYDGNAKVDA